MLDVPDITALLVFATIAVILISMLIGSMITLAIKEREIRHIKRVHSDAFAVMESHHKHVCQNFDRFEKEWERAIVTAPVLAKKTDFPGAAINRYLEDWKSQPMVARAFRNANAVSLTNT